MKKTKVLFVCLGNICRSPLAEALFTHKLRERKWEHKFEVDSCGTSNYHTGEPPDERTLANAARNGIRINHVARQLTMDDLSHYDYILAMDKSNYEHVLRLARGKADTAKVKLIRSFEPHAPSIEVPDPYYGGERGFQEVFEILDRSTEGFLEHLESQLRPDEHLQR